MPLYAFKCPQCGLEFEVSRRMSEASKPATCPLDNTEGSRIFTAPVTVFGGRKPDTPPPDPKPQPQGGWSHFGHSHGFGVAAHSHGRPAPPPKPAE